MRILEKGVGDWVLTCLTLVLDLVSEGRKCLDDHLHKVESGALFMVSTVEFIYEALERTTETLVRLIIIMKGPR
jgi:hypothetical protein